jgi:hypothetical protein
MTDLPPEEPQATPPPRRWRPLGVIDRRVAGVLAEKAKTTPDIYPMSLNAICTGCNQKSNRSPLVQFEPDEVEESLDRLRELGAVGLVEGYGRVQKYRHYLYEWLGVDKVELAVMTELLLRGDQTVGELRGRASRMEPIADLAALQRVLESLKSKGLVIPLTPEGRGHVVSHAIYLPREMEVLRAKYHSSRPADYSEGESSSFAPSAHAGFSDAAQPRTPRTFPTASHSDGGNEAVRRELANLQTLVANLQRELDEIRDAQARTAEDVLALKEALGG